MTQSKKDDAKGDHVTANIRDLSPYYVLDADRNVVPANVLTWARYFEDGDKRQIKLHDHGNARVSTVFTGLPSTREMITKPARPLVFETRVFGGPLDGQTKRYATWDEAIAGHVAMLARVVAASAS